MAQSASYQKFRTILPPRPQELYQPKPLAHWVGRKAEMNRLSEAWSQAEAAVVVVTGPCGAGKTSLMSEWYEQMKAQNWHGDAPDGVLWWSFELNPNLEMFLEMCLHYFAHGGGLSPNVGTNLARVLEVLNIVKDGRYLLFLDGVETIQNKEEDLQGRIENEPLRYLIRHWAYGQAGSGLLVMTGRYLPRRISEEDHANGFAIDLSDSQFTQEEVHEFYKKLGIKGSLETCNLLAYTHAFHPLTMFLVGMFVKAKFRGKADKFLPMLQERTAELPSEKFQSVVQWLSKLFDKYDAQVLTCLNTLTTAEPYRVLQTVLELFVKNDDGVFFPEYTKPKHVLRSLQHLESLGFISFLKEDQRVFIHDLLKGFFNRSLPEEPNNRWHQLLGKTMIQQMPDYPNNLFDVVSVVEGIKYALSGRAKPEVIFAEVVYPVLFRDTDLWLVKTLGAYETCLEVCLPFYPGQDFSAEPKITNEQLLPWLHLAVGLSLKALGRYLEADQVLFKVLQIRMQQRNWRGALSLCFELFRITVLRGNMRQAQQYAQASLEISKNSHNQRDLWQAHAVNAWFAFLAGSNNEAGRQFSAAMDHQKHMKLESPYLIGQPGLWCVEFIVATGDIHLAKTMAEHVVNACRSQGWADEEVQGWNKLARIEAKLGNLEPAHRLVKRAMAYARQRGLPDLICETLIATGWVMVLGHNLKEAREAIAELLDLCQKHDIQLYRIEALLITAHIAVATSDIERAHKAISRLRVAMDTHLLRYHVNDVTHLETVLEELETAAGSDSSEEPEDGSVASS